MFCCCESNCFYKFLQVSQKVQILFLTFSLSYTIKIAIFKSIAQKGDKWNENHFSSTKSLFYFFKRYFENFLKLYITLMYWDQIDYIHQCNHLKVCLYFNHFFIVPIKNSIIDSANIAKKKILTQSSLFKQKSVQKITST